MDRVTFKTTFFRVDAGAKEEIARGFGYIFLLDYVIRACYINVFFTSWIGV